MATEKQMRAAKQNVRKAQRAATAKRTIASLPESTRRGLQEQARRGRRRGDPRPWPAITPRCSRSASSGARRPVAPSAVPAARGEGIHPGSH